MCSRCCITLCTTIYDDRCKYFSNAHKAYHDAAVGEWSGQAWQQPGEKPYQLFRGIGFAGWLYEVIPGDVVTKVNIAQKIHLLLSCLVSLLLGIFYYVYREKLNYRVFLLGSLKVYLAVFYNFIQVPYNYLFLSMIFVSLPILAVAMIKPYEHLNLNTHKDKVNVVSELKEEK